MKVAGKTDDELCHGEELLTDEGDGDEHHELAGDGMATMKGPIYPEGRVRLTVGRLKVLIARALK